MEKERQKFPTLKQFLSEAGVQESTPNDKIEELKQHYRKAYQKHYQTIRKQRENRLEARLSNEELRLLKRSAKGHQRKHLSRFLKESALAYAEKVYVYPKNKVLRELINQVRAIGVNVNQVVQVMHTERIYGNTSDYKKIKSNVDEIRALVESFGRNPKEVTAEQLKTDIAAYLSIYPEHQSALSEWINTLDISTSTSISKHHSTDQM